MRAAFADFTIMFPPHLAARPSGLALPAVLLAALLCLLVQQSPAVEKDAFELLRQTYHRGVAEATLEKERAYVVQLTDLEERFRKRKDYSSVSVVAAEIEAARLRIAALESLSQAEQGTPGQTAAPTSPDSEGEGLLLDAETAVISGNLRFDADRAVVTGFRKPGDEAQWKLPDGLAGGGYEVVLHYIGENNGGGSIRVEAGFFHLPGQVESAGRSKDVQSKHLGTLKLMEGTSTLRVVAQTVGNENLMQLKSLELRPSSHQP